MLLIPLDLVKSNHDSVHRGTNQIKSGDRGFDSCKGQRFFFAACNLPFPYCDFVAASCHSDMTLQHVNVEHISLFSILCFVVLGWFIQIKLSLAMLIALIACDCMYCTCSYSYAHASRPSLIDLNFPSTSKHVA